MTPSARLPEAMSDSPNDSNLIATMWFDGPLRLVDRMCLASMIAQGMQVHLYTYGDVPNAPDGVCVRDGRAILDPAVRDRLMPIAKKEQAAWLPTSQFSDFFRIFLQQHSAGLWLDTDVLLFRPFRYRTDQAYFAREDSTRIGSPVWYLPTGHPIIDEYESLLRQDRLMPNWLGLRRGVLKPLAYRLRGQRFSPPDLGITLYGNDGFTRLAKRHRCYHQALPKHTYYHWAGAENRKVFEKKEFFQFLDDPRHIGLHIHKKAFATDVPVRGSLWEWMMQRYR
jgi:hypothetical protein